MISSRSLFSSILVYFLSANLWGQATSVPGKPFEYLAGLSQTSTPAVAIKDSVGTEIGTYLGIDYDNQRVLLGLHASVEGEEFSFIVGADQSGFSAHRSQVIYLYPWILGSETAAILQDCPYDQANNWPYFPPEHPCSLAIAAYIQQTSPCDQAPYLYVYENNDVGLAVGGFFSTVILRSPGATVVRVREAGELDGLMGGVYERYTPMITTALGGCLLGSVPYDGYYYFPKVPVHSIDILGDLYDSYTTPFTIEFK